MLNRCAAFVIALAFLFTAPAGASTHAQTLAEAIKDFNYAINVEWDQKDPRFYEEQMNRFQAALSDLSTQGMTQAQMLTEARALVKDSQTAAELDRVLALVKANNLSDAEAKRMVMEMVTKSQNRGASWNGAFMINFGILIALVVVIAVLGGGESTCGGEGQPECVTPTCTYGYFYQCGGYWDQFGIYRFQVGCDYQWSCL